MRPVGIVLIDVLADGFSQLARAFIFIYVNQIVFQRPEKTLCTDIIKGLAFAIHRCLYAMFIKQPKVFRISEMATLIAVYDFRLVEP